MKLAIVKLSSLGDIIHAAVVLQFIKAQVANIQIDWFVDASFQDILANNPDLDQVIPLALRKAKKQKRLFVSALRTILNYRHQYDLIIDMQGLIKSGLIARIMGRQVMGFCRSSIREKLAANFYHKKMSIAYEANTIDRYCKLVATALNIKISNSDIIDKKPYLFYKQEDTLVSQPFFHQQKKNIIFTVGSTWESRIYPKEQLAVIANELKENVLIPYNSPAELERAQYIAQQSKDVQILPKMNLSQLTACISQADLLIGGDSGPGYIAWANNIPAVLLFGPTPTTRIYETPVHRVLKSPSKVNPYKLNKNDFSIREIPTAEILKLAIGLLNTNSNPS